MRVVALLATYNERRFVGPCIEHLYEHGVETYLIDNCSSDETVELARQHLGAGLIGVETVPRHGGIFRWRDLLWRKEELAQEIAADWLIHVDADELRLPPPGAGTLAEALETVDREGFNAVNFIEFAFVPTREAPDHDHPRYRETLDTYYAHIPGFPHRLNAWKKTDGAQLAISGGHRVKFADLRMYPESFPMRHYLFLSASHAVEKYVRREYDQWEVDLGLHGWRARLTERQIQLPSRSELLVATPGEPLDASQPRRRHFLAIPDERERSSSEVDDR